VAVLIGLGDTDPAETDPGELLGLGQLAAQGESLGHGPGKQYGMLFQEVLHEESHGLGVIPDSEIGLAAGRFPSDLARKLVTVYIHPKWSMTSEALRIRTLAWKPKPL
jgi:hypothetical protein